MEEPLPQSRTNTADNGRPEHSFFIADHPVSASETAGDGGNGCRFCGEQTLLEEYVSKNFAHWKAAIAGRPAPTGVEYSCQKQVGCQAAVASRLAPTGVEYSFQKQVGCQAAIAGRPAPTGVEYSFQKQVGCQAAVDGKPALTGLSTPSRNRSAVRPPSMASQPSRG